MDHKGRLDAASTLHHRNLQLALQPVDGSIPAMHPTTRAKYNIDAKFPSAENTRHRGTSCDVNCDVPASAGDFPVLFLRPQKQVKLQRYSKEQWDAVKPTLWNLYMERCLPLQMVMHIMAQEWGFHPTIKMYKDKFRRWIWNKNKRTHSPDVAPSDERQPKTQNNAPSPLTQHIESPDSSRNQELVIFASQAYIRAQFQSHGWSSSPFTFYKAQQAPEETKPPDFFALETSLLYCMHHMHQGKVHLAFKTLGRIFDNLNGAWRPYHPKLLGGHWLLLRKVYDICVMAKDKDFALLRELLRFKGNGARSFLKEQPSSTYPLPNLLITLAGMSGDEPETIKDIFRTGMVAAAGTLEETVGLDHPTVLLAWQNVSWHLKLPMVTNKNLIERFMTILEQAEARFGRTDPIAIGVLYDFAHVVFHDDSDRKYTYELATDLIKRTEVHVREGPPEERSQVIKAHAFSTVVLGLFALEDGQSLECRSLLEAAIAWFSSGGYFSRMYAEIMEADLENLLTGWHKGADLRGLELNFLRPRCIDTER